MIFEEVCLDRFNFGGVNYDFLSAASRIWNLYLAGLVGVLLDILIIWKIRDRTFSRVIPNLKDTVFGGVYGMDETSDLGVCNYCAIERYHRVRFLGESNKQVA